jgi:hypothetical protein
LIDSIDSADGSPSWIGEVEGRRGGVKARVDDDDDDDDECMRDTRTDRDDDSMNDLSEIDRRGFFRTKGFIDEFHLLNC